MSDEIRELTKEVKDMAKSIHELTVSLTGFCAKQDGLSDTIQELKKDTAVSKAKIYEKLDRQDERLRNVEIAVGSGKVFDDINKNKIISYWPHALSVASLAFAIIMWVKG